MSPSLLNVAEMMMMMIIIIIIIISKYKTGGILGKGENAYVGIFYFSNIIFETFFLNVAEHPSFTTVSCWTKVKQPVNVLVKRKHGKMHWSPRCN